LAGAGVSGLGKGAICVVCHNQAFPGAQCDPAHQPVNGISPSACVQSGPTFLHEDTDTVAPKYIDVPHDNTQAEILLGRDAFFMGGSLPMLSKHANVQDSCVGCHMTLNPQTHISHGSPAVSDHVFYITDAERPTLCANCHSAGDVNGLAVVSNTMNGIAQLSAAMGRAIKSQLPATFYVGGKLVNTSSVTAVSYNNVIGAGTSALLLASSHSYSIAFYSGTTLLASGTLPTITSDSAGTIPVFGATSVFRKAIWNYFLITEDYSNGIHNPSFVSSVLANTLAQVNSLITSGN
jgi:hypothetical protein